MQIKTEISNLINYRLYLTILQVVENYLKNKDKQKYDKVASAEYYQKNKARIAKEI